MTTGSIANAGQNVLLIIADDLGADMVGLYSTADTAATPSIDSLAADGVLFTNAWSYPTCSPTRSAILTGRFGFRTGVGFPGDQIPLTEFTIPDALNNAGYATACIGKWHLGGNSNGGINNPTNMGFDYYEGATTGGISDYYNWTKVTNGSSSTITNYATSETVDNAITWINNQGTDDWFCQVAFNAPHSPFHKPPNDLHSYDSLSGSANHINNNPELYYKAMIEAMDTEMERLLNSISSSVLANTNVIFIGDNGTPNNVSPGIRNGTKGTLYEGGVHVPFIVKGPIVSGSLNRSNDSPIHVVDLFDTIIEMAGATNSGGAIIDSLSIVDYLTNENQSNYHSFSYTEQFRSSTNPRDGEAIRNETYKLIKFTSSGNEEMYNLFSDPNETTNLLDGSLTNTQQTNYDSLTTQFNSIFSGATTISDVDFESGWDIWNDGGSDARRSSTDAAYSNGSYSIRLRDNTNTSTMTTDVLDLSAYSSITVDFSYYVRSFDNVNEDFWFQISTDGGSSFTTVEEWNTNDEFVNDSRESGSVTISSGLNSTIALRFRADASGNSDWVYIDDVVITGSL